MNNNGLLNDVGRFTGTKVGLLLSTLWVLSLVTTALI
jgi:hypothetical protein